MSTTTIRSRALSHLDRLEAEAVHILREVAGQCANPALLFSGGKDSVVLLRLAEKAFRPGRFPFPLLHIDTGHNYPEVIAFRDRRAAELGERLIVHSVEDSMARGTVVLKSPGEGIQWNRNLSTASYTLYQSPTFDSAGTMTAPDANSSSSLCLSCHDGTIAVDAVLQPPTTGVIPSPMGTHPKMAPGAGNCGACHHENGFNETVRRIRHGFLGTDLSNDHPVNFTYDSTIDPGLRPAAGVIAGGLKLFDGKLQCASCHDPHVPLEKAFLRKSNAASALCTTCHKK